MAGDTALAARRGTAVVFDLVLIGLAIALDPLPLTAFLIVLPSKRGVRKGDGASWITPIGDTSEPAAGCHLRDS